MQLSISIPVPPPQAPDQNPAASSKGGIANDPGQDGGNPPDAFSQLLPASAPAAGGSAPQSKSPAKPTREQEEAAAALNAGWLAALAPHTALPIVPEAAAGAKTAAVAPSAGVAAQAAAGQLAAASTATASLAAVAAGAAAAKGRAAGPVPAAAGTPAPAPAAPPAAAAATAAAAKAAANAETAAATAAPAPAALLSAPGQVMRAASAVSEAKIAAPAKKDSAASVSAATPATKRFLNNGDKEVTDAPQSLGTAVAKVTSAMPAAVTAERQTNAPTAFSVTAASASSSGSNAGQQAPQAESVSTPQEAVEAALNAAEMLASGSTAHAVNLQFSVGNQDLSLRVEMKNGAVQATFATDSAQLRSDLAHEWQSTASGNSQSGLHLAQPVFTGAGSFAAGDPGQQQGRGASSGSEAQFPGSSSSSRSFGASSAGDEAPAAVAAPPSSLHLQAFA